MRKAPRSVTGRDLKKACRETVGNVQYRQHFREEHGRSDGWPDDPGNRAASHEQLWHISRFEPLGQEDLDKQAVRNGDRNGFGWRKRATVDAAEDDRRSSQATARSPSRPPHFREPKRCAVPRTVERTNLRSGHLAGHKSWLPDSAA